MKKDPEMPSTGKIHCRLLEESGRYRDWNASYDDGFVVTDVIRCLCYGLMVVGIDDIR